MITRRFREPRGLHTNTKEYCFFVRLQGVNRELMKAAHGIAVDRLGGIPSNPMLLLDMMKVYTQYALQLPQSNQSASGALAEGNIQ